jgi:PAS domain S-box-containing protein
MNSKLTFAAAAIGVAIVGCHIALLSSGSFHRSLPTHLLQLAVIFLATLSAAACARRSQGFSRQFWALIAFGFGVLAVAQALRIYEHFWLSPAPHVRALGIRDFPFVFYMVPFVLALFLHENRRDCIKAAGYLDAMQVVAICFMLFNALIYSRMTGDHAIAADEISRLFSVVVVARNLSVTGAFWLRGEFSSGNERSALRTMAIYLSVYTAGSVLGHWVYNTVYPEPSWIELEGTVPFVIALVLISRWREQPVVAQEQPGEFHRLMSLYLLPSLLPVLVVLTGIGLWRSHPMSTSVVIGVSSFLFGLRLLVTSYNEHHAAGKLAARTGQLESANAQLQTYIAQRKQAEEALRKSELRYRTLFQNSPIAVLLTTTDDGVVAANSAACVMFGMSEAEVCLAGRDGLVDVSDPRFVAAAEERQRTGRVVATEVNCFRANGDRFPTEADSVILPGAPLEAFVMLRDITERKRAEETLLRSEKLASLGRMAAAIAHEINNPVDAVMNLLFLAQDSNGLPESTRELLETADAELRRVAHITRQSLGFYRESNAPALTSVTTVLDSVLDLLKNRIKAKHATVDRQWDGDVQITAVGGELRQVFSNLVSNSLDAIDGRGRIKLRVSVCGHRVRVTIADNGRGIPPSALQHIFEPFFTTKDAVGNGLGLWVSQQIIEKHGGTIRVRSRSEGLRRGTTFSIVLLMEPTPMAEPFAAG